MRIRNVLVAAAVVVGVSVAPVAAQTSYVGGDSDVKGENFGRGGDQSDRPNVAGDADGRGLPITGGDVAGLTAIGFAAIGAGTVLVRRTRRSSVTA